MGTVTTGTPSQARIPRGASILEKSDAPRRGRGHLGFWPSAVADVLTSGLSAATARGLRGLPFRSQIPCSGHNLICLLGAHAQDALVPERISPLRF